MKGIGGKPKWTEIISPSASLINLKLKEIWQYRDLLYLFIKRDFITVYKQTIFGPLWFFMQPLLTTLMFTVVFGRIAGIPTDGVPRILFYMAGITCWNYFSNCFTANSTTFTSNQNLFGKVYFPRLIVPLSVILSNLLKFLIQLLLFIGFYIFFIFAGARVFPTYVIFLFPLLILITAGLSLGFSLIISALTTKYRDLNFLLTFGIQLAMYATPVIYPLSNISPEHQWILVLNPMTSVIETFRYAFLGHGTYNCFYLGYSFIFMIILLFLGVIIFNRTEKNFMDTV